MSTPEPDDGNVDVEAAWAEIVARWDDPPHPGASGSSPAATPDPGDAVTSGDAPGDRRPRAGGAAPGPGAPSPGVTGGAAAGATGGPGTRAAPEPRPAEPARRPAEADDDLDDWGPPRSHVGGERVLRAAQDDERRRGDADRFVPPDPPPLPRGDLPSRLAWAGVLGSPLFFLVCALFWRDVPSLLVVAGIAAFVAGFGALVVRMPASRDDGDDGAVV